MDHPKDAQVSHFSLKKREPSLDEMHFERDTNLDQADVDGDEKEPGIAPENSGQEEVNANADDPVQSVLGRRLVHLFDEPFERQDLTKEDGHDDGHKEEAEPDQLVRLRVEGVGRDDIEGNVAKVGGDRDEVEEQVAQGQKVHGHLGLVSMCVFKVSLQSHGDFNALWGQPR